MDKLSLSGFVVLVIVLFLFLPGFMGFTGNVATETERETEPTFVLQVVNGDAAIVSRVIDGDTVVLSDSERVRLLGINTPEQGQMLFSEAGQRLEELIMASDGAVLLESDVTDKDKYDRLLRYIYIESDNGYENVNIKMVVEGFASVYIIEPDHRYVEELSAAEEYAREHRLGIWQYSDIEDVFCIGLHYPFKYNAAGDDRYNLNGEYLILRNSCTYPVDLSGWRLMDNLSKEYMFPSFTLMNKSTVTVHTGTGSDNETDLYWGLDWPVWNNDGDVLRLWNSENNLILNHRYKH